MSSFINRFNLVKQIPAFAKLNWIEIQRIARKSIIAEYDKGDLICKEGSPPDFFYCLISGRLQAYSLNEQREKGNIEFIHRGMYFGILSILTGENHSLNFEAINHSVILKITRDDFQAILKAVPKLGLEFSETLSRRMRSKVQGKKSVFESKIISVYSPVKGTGSSAYAINLALNLQKETGKNVIFVSIHSKQNTAVDPTGSSPKDATPRWRYPAVDIYDIVGDHQQVMEHVIKDELQISLLNVFFDAGEKTTGAEPKASLKKEISLFVTALVGDYHYVVVDLPNEMDDVVLEALTQSDLVHLIVFDRKKDLTLIRRVVDRLQEGFKENFREEKVRVIIRALHAKVYLSFEEINKFIDYEVYTVLPFIERAEFSVDVASQSLSFLRCPAKCEYARAVRRIAREIGGVMVGLVLGGGAALGLAHVGVIRVLEQEDIPIDVVAGSSMGALIGSLWCTGKNADELEKIAREFEKKRNILKLCDPVLPVSGLIGGRLIKRWLKKYLGNRTFYSTTIPFKVVSYDLTRREEIVINGGSIVDAVRQSIAIPGVIEPIRKKDQIIIDGGVLNPLPTNVLAALGIKKIIAVNVLQSPDDVSEGFDISQHKMEQENKISFFKAPLKFLSFRLGRAMAKVFNPNISDIIVSTLQASEYVIAEQSALQADVNIHPDLVGIKWYELDRGKELIQNGEAAAREHLPEIKKLIES